jgi:SNF2 family DNA or RNA helicase
MLVGPRPADMRIGTEEASDFVRVTACLLEDAGFAVSLPALGAAPRLHLDVDEGAGGFGLEALLAYQWQVALGSDTMDPREFRRLTEQKIPLVRLRDQWLMIEPGPAARMLDLWSARDGRPLTLGDALRIAAEHGSLELAFHGALAALGDPLQVPPIPPPSELRAQLRPYQAHGFSWLVHRIERGLGACLADDMGLGKTIQMIAVLLHEKGRGPWLLICPTSLVGNWARELGRFAPSLRVGIHHGRARAQDVDVLLTTYGMVARDPELAGLEWRGVALDEAQNIKNHDSRQAQGVRALRAEARVAMSGTPVENRLADLWSIMDFLNPGLLGSLEAFRRRFAIPVERYGDDLARARLRRAVAPFLLRRVKTDPSIVPDLPEKLERKIYCPLSREQAALYEATVRERLDCIDHSEGIARRGVVLATMLRLKQICNHPQHFLGDEGELSAESGKLARLEEMLEEVLAGGERALVFTQFREWGIRLASYLEGRFGVEVACLHGETPREERDRLVARFQADDGPPLFVLSVKAGGVGLTLTRATHIFHFDRWWNPAVENQATDRAFRIGQRRNVQVHKFVCLGTLEESIDRLIESKRGLAESVVGGGEGWLTEMSTTELRELLAFRPDGLEPT